MPAKKYKCFNFINKNSFLRDSDNSLIKFSKLRYKKTLSTRGTVFNAILEFEYLQKYCILRTLKNSSCQKGYFLVCWVHNYLGNMHSKGKNKVAQEQHLGNSQSDQWKLSRDGSTHILQWKRPKKPSELSISFTKGSTTGPR